VQLLDLLLRFVNTRLIFIDVGNNPVGFGDFGQSPVDVCVFCQIQRMFMDFVKIQRILFDFGLFVCSTSKDMLCICAKKAVDLGGLRSTPGDFLWTLVEIPWIWVDVCQNQFDVCHCCQTPADL